MAKRKTGSVSGFRILNERTENVPIDSVQPHPRNVNESDLGALIESEKRHGFYGSVIVQKSTGYILAGTHRWKAAKELGAAEIPATFIDVDDDGALRIMLVDNRTTRLGHDATDRLAELLQELITDTGSLEGTGFDGDDLDQLLSDLGQVGEAEFPTLASGDKQPFQQMTFTLHDEQAEQVKRALESSKALGPFTDSPNENSNGNALARVCETFLTAHANG